MLQLTRSTFGLAVLMLLVSAASAVAADGYEINICLNSAGNVRFVPPGTACRSNERLVTWNTQGALGPAGPQGSQGPQGVIGPQGVVGPQGVIGPQGVVGPQGVAGPQGEVGPQGSNGANGADGAVGPQGPVAPGPGPALVLDSNDAIIGRYINRTGDVLVHVGTDYFVVGATLQGFVATGTFIHQEAGCLGPPAIAATANALSLTQVALVKPGEAWLPDFGASRITLPANSPYFYQVFFANGSSSRCMEDVVFSDVTLTPLRRIPLSGFRAPFHVQ